MFSELTKKLCTSSFRKDLKKRESKGKYNLKKQRFRTKLIEGRVSVKGISLWNNVNKEIEEFQSNITSKEPLRSVLLRKHNEKMLVMFVLLYEW